MISRSTLFKPNEFMSRSSLWGRGLCPGNRSFLHYLTWAFQHPGGMGPAEMTISIFWERKPQFRRFQWLAQGHTSQPELGLKPRHSNSWSWHLSSAFSELINNLFLAFWVLWAKLGMSWLWGVVTEHLSWEDEARVPAAVLESLAWWLRMKLCHAGKAESEEVSLELGQPRLLSTRAGNQETGRKD